MFDVHAYLRTELARYYPGSKIDVHEGDERWDIGIRFPNSGAVMQLHMDVGSDDDYFTFKTEWGRVITVPFAPEMEA